MAYVIMEAEKSRSTCISREARKASDQITAWIENPEIAVDVALTFKLLLVKPTSQISAPAGYLIAPFPVQLPTTALEHVVEDGQMVLEAFGVLLLWSVGVCVCVTLPNK